MWFSAAACAASWVLPEACQWQRPSPGCFLHCASNPVVLPSVNFRFGFLTGMTLLNAHRKSWTH